MSVAYGEHTVALEAKATSILFASRACRRWSALKSYRILLVPVSRRGTGLASSTCDISTLLPAGFAHSRRWLGVRHHSGVEQDAGFLTHCPGVVPWFQDEHIPGSDSQFGTVVRANRHPSRHTDACVPCLARPGPRDQFDVSGPLPTRLERPSAQREVPQSYHVEVAVRLELAGLVRGPFDYHRGIGLFKGVGKFDALLDVNLADRLHAALPHLTGDITFVNDADAFAVGEWRQGVTAAAARSVGITLGSGVGSSFLDNGIPVTSGPIVPPHGRAHRLKIGNADLEDVVSRRAILARYLAGPNVTSALGLDVHDVFNRSRGGDDWATQVLEDAFSALGGALAPWFTRFQATAVAFGGAMTGSWDLILPSLRRGLITAGAGIDIALLPWADTERSALVGAATQAHPMEV